MAAAFEERVKVTPQAFEGASRYELALEQQMALESGDSARLRDIEREIARLNALDRPMTMARRVLRSLLPSRLAFLSWLFAAVVYGVVHMYPRPNEQMVAGIAVISGFGMTMAVISLALRQRPLYAGLVGIVANAQGTGLLTIGLAMIFSPNGWMH